MQDILPVLSSLFGNGTFIPGVDLSGIKVFYLPKGEIISYEHYHNL